MKFTAKTFVDDITQQVAAGRATLEYLMAAYGWGFEHIREIHKYSPGYTQAWLDAEIKKVFNVDPQQYAMVCRKLGGGSATEQKATGFALVRRFGYWECCRATRLLTTEQLERLGASVTEKTEQGEFVAAVDQMAEVLKTKTDNGAPERVDWKKRAMKAEQRIQELEVELRTMRQVFRKLKIQAEVSA